MNFDTVQCEAVEVLGKKNPKLLIWYKFPLLRTQNSKLRSHDEFKTYKLASEHPVFLRAFGQTVLMLIHSKKVITLRIQ